MFNCCYILPLPSFSFFTKKWIFWALNVSSELLRALSAASWAKRAPKQKRGRKRRGGRAAEPAGRRARGRGSATGRQIRQPLYSPFNTLYYFFISLSFSGENIHKKPVGWEAVTPSPSLTPLSLALSLSLTLSVSFPTRAFCLFLVLQVFPLDSSSTIHLDIQQWVSEGRSRGMCCFWNLQQPQILTTSTTTTTTTAAAPTMRWEICIRIVNGIGRVSRCQLSVVRCQLPVAD